MATFVYDSTKVDVFVPIDNGDITASVGQSLDYGNITSTPIDETGPDNFDPNYWGLITTIGDIVPFGSIGNLSGGEAVAAIVGALGNGLFDINAQALTNPVRRFIGTGTLHEMGSGLERLVIPDLGAAGPVLTSLQGTHTLKFTKGNYSGSGTLLNTASAATAEFNVYPWSATGSLTLSGTTTTPYQDAYIPIIKNSAKIKGRGVDYLIKNYARPIDAKFDLEDNGFVTSTFGGKFSDSDDLTFDRIKTKLKDRSFSDSDQLTSEDFGLLSVTTRVITVDTPTVLDAPTLATATYNYNASNVFVASNGTGTGNNGGFAIGDHFKFGSAGGQRYFWWRFNTEYSDSIKFKVIRGNWSNGGERPDQDSESLYLDRWTGSAWVSVATVGAWDDDTLDQLTEVEVPLSASNKGYYYYRLRQPNASNSANYDHWGVSSIEYSVRTTPTVPIENEDRGVLERKLGGGLFLHQYQATGVGAQEAFPYAYEGTGSLFKYAAAEAPEFGFAYSGSGTATFSGTNFFSQAPQSTVFGVGDKLTVSGAATESFTPATVDNAVLFNQTGSANESIVSQAGERKLTVRLTGSVSDISIVTGSGDKSNTVLFNISGGYTNLQSVKSEENTNLFNFSGGLLPDRTLFIPSWVSATGEAATEEYDWGLITVIPPTQISEDFGPIATNDETIPKVAENWGFLLGEFNYVQLGGEHYPNIDSLSEGDTSLVVQTGGTLGILTIRLSDDVSAVGAYDYESSGITGIATYKAGINIFGYNWFSQAPQHTVFGLGDQLNLTGIGGESITPATEIGSGSLFTIGGLSESVTKAYLQGDYSYLGGTADQVFSPAPVASGIATLRTGRAPGQTYARIIDLPDDQLGGLITIVGAATSEKNTDSYNESSIFYGPVDENWGEIDGDPGFGFDLGVQGQAVGTETFDDETNRYDQDVLFSNNGLTYDQGSGGVSVLPSFDKTDVYSVDLSNTVNSEDFGQVGDSTVGGPDYDQYLYPHYTGFSHQSNIGKGYIDYGWVNSETNEPTRYPFGIGPHLVDASPLAITQWIPKFNGSGSLVVSGIGVERVAVASSNTTLFEFVGTTSPERFIAQTPENTVLYEVSGIASESVTKDFVGSGSITLSKTDAVGFTTYRRIIIPPASGITTITGYSTEKFSGDPPEGTYLHIFDGTRITERRRFAAETLKATLRLSGELNHPDIDFTPHYGIDRNIGIETGFTFSPGGGLNEDGTAPGIVTTRYLPDYPGNEGPIVLSGKAIGRTNAPINTSGTIFIVGIRTDVPQDYDGPTEVGAGERFIPATEIGGPFDDFTFTGASVDTFNRVFGYYGDDRDPGTSGTITISTEKRETRERTITIEGSGGLYQISGAASDEATTFSEVGSGSLYTMSGLAESVTAAELVAGTQTLVGTAEESFIAQTPEETATITLSGTGVAQRRAEYDGSGTLTVYNTEKVVTGIRVSLKVSGRFSILSGAAEAVGIPGAASSVLVDIAGVAETRYFQVFQDFVPSGTITLSGELTHPDIDYTPAYTGSGNITISGATSVKFLPRVVSVFGLFVINGTAGERFVSSEENTILFNIDGDASTREIAVYQDFIPSGISTFSGAAATREIANYGYYGDDRDPGTSGTITLSNTPLVHPFVDYTPHIGKDTSVLFQVGGAVGIRRVFPPYSATGSLFKYDSSDEAYARSTYVGIGQVNFFGAGFTEILRFEEGRTYVVII